MTLRPSISQVGLRRIVRLICCLLPAVLGSSVHAATQRGSTAAPGEVGAWGARKAEGPVPYLRVAATPSIRFRDKPAPPNYELEAPQEAPRSHAVDFVPAAPAVRKERYESSPSTIRQLQRQSAPEEKPGEDIPTILPDELRPEVRPEDVMPFFLFPQGGGGQTGVSVSVPVQNTQPAPIPSSASYQQH